MVFYIVKLKKKVDIWHECLNRQLILLNFKLEHEKI